MHIPAAHAHVCTCMHTTYGAVVSVKCIRTCLWAGCPSPNQVAIVQVPLAEVPVAKCACARSSSGRPALRNCICSKNTHRGESL